MKRYTLILCMLGCITLSGVYGQKPVSPAVRRPAHPRILLSDDKLKQMLRDISADPVWTTLHQRTLNACDSLLITAPLQRVMQGRRMLNTSREALYRLFMLSYGYRTSGNKDYARRAEKELLAVCRYPDWNPAHFLDVAEMTMAVSIGYDWLWPVLGTANRKLIKQAVLEKGLLPSLNPAYNSSFLDRDNNWNQVCNTAMAYGAVALAEDEPLLSKNIIERSVESIRKPMAKYGPDGAYPEGYGYWHYGTSYNVMLLALLEDLYGTDFGLSRIPGFQRSAYYILHMAGPTGLPFNFGDSGDGRRLNTSLFWFARKRGDQSLIRDEIAQLLEMPRFGYEQYSRMLPSVFIFGHTFKPGNSAGSSSLPCMFVAENEAPVCLMRSSWNSKDAIFAAIKAGTPSDNNHTHLDEGTFVMESSGVRWALDLGPQDYESIEKQGISLWDNSPGSSRWNIFRYNNLSHNVLSVNNNYFNAKGKAVIKSWSDKPALMTATLSLTPMYGGELAYAERTLSIVDKKLVVLTDSVRSAAAPAQLTWRMLTAAKAEVIKGGILLRQEGKLLFLALPPDVTPFISPATGSKSYDAPNPGISIAGYRFTLAPGQTRSFHVKLIPLTNENEALIN